MDSRAFTLAQLSGACNMFSDQKSNERLFRRDAESPSRTGTCTRASVRYRDGQSRIPFRSLQRAMKANERETQFSVSAN